MKRAKKLIHAMVAVGMAVVMAVTVLPASSTVSAATAVKLSKKKLTLKVGQSKKLKVTAPQKAKLSWKSSNKKVVTVSSKGKLKAKKTGKATINVKVKVEGKKVKNLSCKVTVIKGQTTVPKSTSAAVTKAPTSNPPVPAASASVSNPSVPTASASVSSAPDIVWTPKPTPGYEDYPDFSELLSEDAATYADSPKADDENNPLLTNSYACDPYAMEYDGRLYVYMTNDTQQYEATNREGQNTYGYIQSMHIISTDDMVNWTDHGIFQIAGENGVCKWAGCCWAPCAVHKTVDGKEKFYIYFTNGGWQIGVVAADSPIGPFEDIKGEALVTSDMTSSSPLDPAAFIDDDGTAYLTYGSQNEDSNGRGGARIRKMNPDMMSFAEDEVSIGAPYVNEDSGMNKIGDTYYYSYCTDWDTHADASMCCIAYMTAKSPLGPYTYQGEILPNCGTVFETNGNNHHSMVEFKGKYYMFYHTMVLQDAVGCSLGYRSTHVNEISVGEDGSLGLVEQDKAGVEAIKKFDPYTLNSGCVYTNSAGMQAEHMELIMVPKTTSTDDEAKQAEYRAMADYYNANPDYIKYTPKKGEIQDEETRKNNYFYLRTDDGARMEAVADPEKYHYSWSKVANVDFGDAAPITFEASFLCVPAPEASIRVCADSLDGPVIAEAKIVPDETGKATISVPVEAISGVHDIFFEFESGVYSFENWQFIR